jgi:hypothetical protein
VTAPAGDLPARGQAALAYAARQLFVLVLYGLVTLRDGRPACACRERLACQSPGKHPRTAHGVLDATTDAATIRSWWTQWPNSNVAIACEPSKLVVFDIDCKPGRNGFETLRDREAELGPLPETVTAITGSGGEHRYYAAPAGVVVHNSEGDLGPGVDVRATGGYVVAPPSAHLAGQPYRWDAACGLDDVAIAVLPRVWVERLQRSHSGAAAERPRLDVGAILAGVPAGQRNEKIFRFAAKLRGSDVPYAAARDLVLRAAASCSPPLGEREALKVLDGAYARYEPRPVRSERSFARPAAVLEPVPPFPIAALLPPFDALVTEGAAALGCPTDYLALPLLAYAGAVMGRTWAIRLKHAFIQRPILTTCIVGPPGATKTPALLLAREPLDRLQERAVDDYEAALQDYAQAHSAWEQAKRAKRDPGPEPERPTLQHFYTTDSTTEALAPMLRSSAGLVLVRDEITGWVQGFDQYRHGRGSDRQTYLSLWSGAPIKIDRKTAPPIIVPRPVLCVVGGTQPDSLPQLAAEAAALDGFCERIVWAWPDTEPTRWTEAEVAEATQAATLAVFERLRRAEGDVLVALSSGARAVWVPWYDAVHAESRETGDGLLAGVLAKLPNQVARIALILHAVADPVRAAQQPLRATTMRDAITIGDYLSAHARRVLPHLQRPRSPLVRLTQRVRERLERAEDAWVTKRTLFEQLGGHVTAAALDVALGELVELGFAEQRQAASGERGGRPATEWRKSRPASKRAGEQTR